MPNKKEQFNKGEIIIYETSKKEVDLKVRFENETLWLDAHQMAKVFDIDRTGIVRHIQNVYKTKELDKKLTCAKIAQVASDRKVRNMDIYSLDMVISVGYRVNSQKATQFRIWATSILKKHLLDGYTINKKRIGVNYQKFMQATADLKVLLPAGNKIKAKEILELINTFTDTWFSLDAYDTAKFPRNGITKKQVIFTAEELVQALQALKEKLVSKKQATDIFGKDRTKEAVNGIVGNVFQSFAKKDVYPSIEVKAAHLLYFMVKNHPFVDGNKRSGAFAFVWFLRKAGTLRASLSPEALTVLTLLVAESNPKDKDRVIGLILLLLK